VIARRPVRTWPHSFARFLMPPMTLMGAKAGLPNAAPEFPDCPRHLRRQSGGRRWQ
jgi:hypothetical protein